ncbi:hypothetical protein C8J57DRAFT_1499923 [Mycena rebaudengoi]|nr:hypothetical protein C8J57DRAFT_1499923 [Mycena rebaudengoi]
MSAFTDTARAKLHLIEMKRGADRQISRDDAEHEIEEVSGESFKKADDAILATRKIKGIPRRMGGSPSPFSPSSSASEAVNGSATENSTPPPPKFAGFAGFGTPTSSSAPIPFSFEPPTASPSFPAASSSSNLFSSSLGSSPSVFNSGSPAVSSTASNATKTFASLLGDSSSKPNNAAPPPPSTNSTSLNTVSDAADSAALKYYTSLRGLNVSFLAAISQAIDQDPFTDVGSLLSRYSSLRVDVQKEFDERPRSTAIPSAPSPFTFASSTPTAPVGMPAAPTFFAGFGKPAAAAAPPKSNGSTDAPSAPSTSFFSPSASSSTTTFTPKPSVFTPKPSAFGSPSASPFGASASPSPFGAGKSGSVFGSSPSAFSFNKSPSGSLGNPVGFTFGSGFGGGADKTASTSGEKEKDAKSEADEEPEVEEVEAGGSQETERASTPSKTEEGSSSGKLFGEETIAGFDAEGEGEEDEDTLHSARLKVFQLKKDEKTEISAWLDMGIGFIRLKKHKETSTRRLLLRNSQTGKIIINFSLYSGLKVTLTKKTLNIVGHDATAVPQTYSLRLQTEEGAQNLKAAIEKEVAQI